VENAILIDDLINRHPRLEPVRIELGKAAETLITCYKKGGKVLVCGNGGSSSDSDHIVGELMKGFESTRPLEKALKKILSETGGERGKYLASNLQHALPAISLSAHSALITAVVNDIEGDLIFAQQVVGYGNPGDVLIALSTSGNAQNVRDAALTARAKGMTIIGITGEDGGKLRPLCDILINVNGTGTAHIQELHLPVYHTLSRMVENGLFGDGG
jgi:D-sedoheptulose 7-phosphate isomerase